MSLLQKFEKNAAIQESETNTSYKLTVPLNVQPNSKIVVKTSNNALKVGLQTDSKEERPGYHSTNFFMGEYVRSFPFEIKNPVAEIKDNVLVIDCQKGEKFSGNKSEFKDLPVQGLEKMLKEH